MSQLFPSTISESDPKLAPEFFDHSSASEAAIENPKIVSGNQNNFSDKPYLKQPINGGRFSKGTVYVPMYQQQKTCPYS